MNAVLTPCTSATFSLTPAERVAHMIQVVNALRMVARQSGSGGGDYLSDGVGLIEVNGR